MAVNGVRITQWRHTYIIVMIPHDPIYDNGTTSACLANIQFPPASLYGDK